MPDDDAPTRTVKTAERVFDILEAVRELDGARVTELADHLGLANSTVHDHLTTLHRQGYLVREDAVFYISLRFLQHGLYAKNRHRVSTIAQPALDRLAEETGEIVWLAVEEHGQAVYLNKALGDQAVQPYGELGGRVALYNIAAGKAILAHLPPERVDAIVDETEMRQDTENTITDMTDLREEFEAIRERGYAYNKGEVIEGFRAVAAPVVTDDVLHGAVVVSGPASRLRGERFETDLPNRVRSTTNELEMQLRSKA